MKRTAEINELRGQIDGKDQQIKRLDDELRDMENELNMAKHMRKVGNQEEK